MQKSKQTKSMKRLLTVAGLVFITAASSQVYAQNGVGINPTGAAADPSAALDVASTNKGVLVPRMTEAEKVAIASPANGLLIFQTDGVTGFWYYNSTTTSWVQAVGPQGAAGPQGPSGAAAIAGNNVAFKVTTSSFTAPQNMQSVIDFPTTEYLEGAMLNNATGEFTCTESGLYHFDAACTVFDPSGAGGDFYLRLYKNELLFSQNIGNIAYFACLDLSTGLQLTAGDKVTVRVLNPNPNPVTIVSGYFNGHKVGVGAQGPAGATGSVGATGPAGANGQGGVTTAGAGINVTGAGTVASPYVVSTTSPCGLAIGQTYEGGIIFYLDASGCHGLISAPTDIITGGGVPWFNGSNTLTNAVRDGVGAGKFNTERVIANQGAGFYAAELCANYQGGNYGDWYLPSKKELYLMYSNIGLVAPAPNTNVGNFALTTYWSSTEYDDTNAWVLDFIDGNGLNDGGKSGGSRVRAVRAF